MEESSFGFEDFSTEIEDFSMTKSKKFTRLWGITTGGSIDQDILVYKGRLYFGSFNHNFYCISAEGGKLIWKFRTEDRIGCCAPVIHDGVIFIGSYDYNLYALNAENGRLLWKFKTYGELLSAAVISGGLVYFGSRDRFFYAVDTKTGQLAWKYETQGEIISTPRLHEGKLIFGSFDRNVHCIDAATGKLLWKFETLDDVLGIPVGFPIQDGIIYVNSFDNFLRALDINTGREIWRVELGKYGMTVPASIHNNIIYQPTRGGVVYAVDLNGKILWKFVRSEHPFGVNTIHNDRIFQPCEDEHLYCLDLSGNIIWKFKTFEMTWGKTKIIGNRVYFGSYDCNLYCLDYETGKVVWKFRADGSPSYLPPPHESYELEVNKGIPEKVIEDGDRKRYDFSFREKESSTSEYKSEITYQMGSTYMKKGKYQIDSRTEEF
jgi:outer membrane protein assembly factor BamB